jgi:hypothetical protein
MKKEDKDYTALYLENQYLKIMILPELGGRVQMALDKTNGVPVAFNWRGELFMVTQKFQTSELQQMNLLTIRLGNRTYRIPEKAIIDYLRQNGYDHLLP